MKSKRDLKIKYRYGYLDSYTKKKNPDNIKILLIIKLRKAINNLFEDELSPGCSRWA